MPVVAAQLMAEVSVADDATDPILEISDLTDGLAEKLSAMEESSGSFDALGEAAQTAADTLSEVATSADDAGGSLDGIAGSADSIDALNGILEAIQRQTSILVANFSSLETAINGVSDQIQALAVETDQLGEAMESAAAGEADAVAGADDASGAFEGLQSAMGPLMMIGTLAALAGGKLVQMGMQGQQGEALLKGAAGASQADVNALQQAAMQLGLTMDQASQGFYEVESAGYSGSQAITVFDDATKLALGDQANEQDVLSGLTAIMHDYGDSASDAGNITDIMAQAVNRGKQSMSDFATSIGPLASVGETVGVSFQQVAAAEATLTQINPHVKQDAVDLQTLFKSLSPSMGNTAETARKLGLNFNEAHFASLDLLSKLQYLAQIAGGDNTQAFVKLTGGAQGSTAAIDLLSGKASAFTANLKAMSNATGATQNAFNQYDATVPGALSHVGSSLSIMGTKLMDAIGPKVTPIIDKFAGDIGKASDFILSHSHELIPVLAGLAAVIGGALVIAIGSFLVAAGPVLLVLLGIGAAVAGVVEIFQHWGQITSAVAASPLGGVLHQIWSILQGVGSFLTSIFMPVWKELQQLWTGQLLPLFKQLWAAIQPLAPVFELLAKIVGGIVVVALGLLVGLFAGLAKGFAGFLSGLVTVIGGVVQVFTGVVQVISGIIQFLYDLFTGNFNKLGADLGTIWQGIINMFSGAWKTIQGIFQEAWGFISGLLSGFVQGVIGFFTTLWDKLTGHSIVPDMINDIIRVFKNLPGEIANIGQDMINGLSNTIKNGISTLVNDAKNLGSSIGNTIKSFLHFSKPDVGPLTDVDQWMPDFGDLLVNGMNSQLGRIKNASLNVASTLALAGNPVVHGTTSSSSGQGQPIILQLDGRTVGRGLMPHIVDQIRTRTAVGF